MIPASALVRLRRLQVILVVQGEVVEDVLFVDVHAVQSVLDDRCQLVGKGWVVGLANRYHRGEDVAVPVLMLQTLTQHGGAPGGGTQKEPASP